ncbi:MAG TPA: hypothetical protein VGE12_04855 [Noviherbaspirillum sp.]
MRKLLMLALSLCTAIAAHAEVVATGVRYAENAIQTSNQRLFVSSDGAFYELTAGASGWNKTAVPVHFKDGVARHCYFLGVAETMGRVYTVCTENALNPLARKRLFGLDIMQGAPQLVEAGELHGMSLPNGLAADDAGNLYAADSGLPLLPGTIQKITLAGPYTIATQTTFHRYLANKPNGVRYANGKLYVTVNPFSYLGVSQLLRYDLGANGLANCTTIYSSLAFLDDFTLVNGGAVIAEFLGGRIVHVSEQGNELHRASFSQPTSARLLTAPQFGAGNLLVTERGSGNVHRFVNTWGLQPR